MELEITKPNTLPKFQLNGIKRGHYCRLKTDNGFIWAMTTGRQADVFFGVVEHSDQGGPCRGTRLSFEKRHVFEIV